jgi:hypothetical protein
MLLVIYIFYYIYLLYNILYLFILLYLCIFHVSVNTLDSQSRTW